MEREKIIKLLRAQLNLSGHIVGASIGSGMTAKLSAMGGADVLLALSAGKYRIMGRSSLSSYFCYGNNNEQVMELGKREIFPIVRDVPLLFGLMATDPTIQIYDYLQEIKSNGFSGIVNFPTVALIDGKFREALEDEGTTFDREVAAIKLANHFEMFTMAFVTNEEETRQMIGAGADVICVHLGLTKGGFLGAKKNLSIDEARKITEKIFNVCKEINTEVLRMVYAGPASTIVDMKYLYHGTNCQGYIGGSTFDRIPMEKSIFETIQSFKRYNDPSGKNPLNGLIDRKNSESPIEFIRKYVEENYQKEIHIGDLALIAHLSQSYLSTKFKNEVGINFTEYLLHFRLNKAKEILERDKKIQCKEVAFKVGYSDYAQFSKMFKKIFGFSPTEFQKK